MGGTQVQSVWRTILAGGVVMVCWGSGPMAVLGVEPGELKPGLVAVYEEAGDAGKGTTPYSVSRLESTVALLLESGETVHPRLAGLRSARWVGYVNVVRGGSHRFSATIRRGVVVVRVGEQEVLRGQTGDDEVVIRGPEVTLAGGVHRFEAVWTCDGPPPTRCTLWWEGPGFIREPLNGHYLGHLPTQRPAQFLDDVQREHGRFLFEELACIRCHRPAGATEKGHQAGSGEGGTARSRKAALLAQSLADRPGPKLTNLGQRVYPGWLDAWLADPQKLRPQATMPRLFSADAVGQAERYAIVHFFLHATQQPLAVFRPPLLPNSEWKQSVARGRTLFYVTGCAACHQQNPAAHQVEEEEGARPPLQPEDSLYGLGTSQGPTSTYLLGALGSKTRPEVLAAYLRDPHALHPGGRMPQMALSSQEATDLARYLCQTVDETITSTEPAVPAVAPQELFARHKVSLPAGWAQWPQQRQWLAAGEMLLTVKGCVHCHEIDVAGKRLSAPSVMPSLEQVLAADKGKGCLREGQNSGQGPHYTLSAGQRQALQRFLQDGWLVTGRPAPAYTARVTLRRLGCLNCHGRDGEGGIPSALAEQMRLLEKVENADDVRPPVLTGIGHKARRSWLQAVLLQGQRARPWMQLRMPQYGPAHVAGLPEALPRLEGMPPDDTVHRVPVDTQKVAAGRLLIGKEGLGCISCHDISGIANPGTRGPDLATIQQRVRYEWYERWLHQPLRLAPGTRMPQAFVDGQAMLKTVLKGQPQAQAEAMWAYLSLGPGLPLPDGLEPPRGLILTVRQRPELLRTFLPEVGPRSIAVGYPQGIHFAFDAEQCRLAYAWSGNFLDVSPVWHNRGGAPARILGSKFWTSPPVHPWGWTSAPAPPPDFGRRQQDPAWGTPLPHEPPRLYTGPRYVRFEGYTLDQQGRPVFRYTVAAETAVKGDPRLMVQETVGPLRSVAASGLVRQFQWEAPPQATLWFLVGSASSPPRIMDLATGRIRNWDVVGMGEELAAAGQRLLLTSSNGSLVVAELEQAPLGTRWRWVSRGTGGDLLIRFAPPQQEGRHSDRATLRIWSLPRDEEALIRDLDK